MGTRFICCMDNEAVPKAFFKLKDDELTLTKTIKGAQEAARVAKDTVYRQVSKPAYKVRQPKSKANPPKASTTKAKDVIPQGKLDQPLSKGSCGRYGKKNHTSKDCHT